MRGFVSLLFAAALAAHSGPAGAPSLGGAPVCAEEVGAAGHAAGHVLYLASALGASQTEAPRDGREPTGRPAPRRTVAAGCACVAHAAERAVRERPRHSTPASLLGFPGHPTTAPPLQA